MGPMTLRAPPTHCTLAQHVDSSSQRACRHLEARGPQCSEGPAQVTQWSCKAGRVCCFLGHAGLAGYVRGRCSLGCTSSQAAPPAGTGWRRGAIQWACCFVGPRAASVCAARPATNPPRHARRLSRYGQGRPCDWTCVASWACRPCRLTSGGVGPHSGEPAGLLAPRPLSCTCGPPCERGSHRSCGPPTSRCPPPRTR